MTKIISIGTAVPEHRTKQSAILEFMQDAYNDNTASRKLNMLFSHSGIEARYSAIPDFDKSRNEHVFFNGSPGKATVSDKLNVFKECAVPLAIKAIHSAFENLNLNINGFGVTHLITVTCTGLSAPGIDAEIIEQLSLPNDIFRTSVNFLGCNAAFHALKIADMILKTDAAAKVLIVSVELCTLHFQPKNDNDNLLSNTIFGDGAAAVILTSSDTVSFNEQQRGLTIDGFYSILLKDGKDLMGWNITPVNFEMVLDARIPDFIGSEVNNIIQQSTAKFKIEAGEIGNWAIHPGGKKIVDTIKTRLQLSDKKVEASYKVLSEYGNMSSSTILFVIKELMEQGNKKDEKIFSIGFGPGLSIETALLSYE